MSFIRPLAPASSPHPSLQEFREAAERAADTCAQAGTDPQAVFGPGNRTGTSDAVMWRRDGEASTHMFIEALKQSFGDPLGVAIARELSLDPGSGRALSPHDVRRAIEMGETAQVALTGVGFGNRLWTDASPKV